MADSYKLTYFAGKGLAEPTRIMFALAGQAFEDERFPYHVDAADAASKHPEFTAAQQTGAFAVSMHSLPVLTFNGVRIGQSKAIERFVAARLGMAGADEVERAQIDCVCEHLRELNDAFVAQVCVCADCFHLFPFIYLPVFYIYFDSQCPVPRLVVRGRTGAHERQDGRRAGARARRVRTRLVPCLGSLFASCFQAADLIYSSFLVHPSRNFPPRAAYCTAGT
jgi:hypothetical protein